MWGHLEIESKSIDSASWPKPKGWVEVIAGSMFSGKTEELLRRLRRAMIAKQKCLLIKPKIDTRYAEDFVVSHDQNRLPCVTVNTPEEILLLSEEYSVLGIDEAQFFAMELAKVCDRLAERGKRVIVAGLDQDFRGHPFGAMGPLMISAEYVTKQLAICMQCGSPATKNQRLVGSDSQVLLGAKDLYEARCRHCFEPPRPEPKN
jgi:thymidine kinase